MTDIQLSQMKLNGSQLHTG